MIEISDSGIGMSRESQKNLFEAFTQAETSMARRFGGTGLGLSICKKLIEKMGGEIGVTSEEGVGSKFWFRIKLARCHAPVFVSSDSKPSLSALFPQAPKILVAEDNYVNQVITVRMLEKMGCRADVAVNGLEATRKIRKMTIERNRGIPVLAITANAMSGDRELCIEAGMDDHIAKPVSYECLEEVLVKWLKSTKT